MAEKADPDAAVKLESKPATLTTFWANNQTAQKKNKGQKRTPQALPTQESSGEDIKQKTERKRQRKKEAKGEAISPVPFLSLGRMVPGPGEEYGEEDYVLLPDVFGDMGKKKSKQSLKPSLPSPKEAESQKGEKQSKDPAPVKARAPDNEERGEGLNQPVEKGKRWADWMEEDKAEAARARAELNEEKQRWRAQLREEEVVNLDAPSGKTVMELLAKREAQGKREEQPKLGAGPLGEGLVKTALPKEVSPSLKTGKEGKGVPDSAMEMALKIKDPIIQANVACTLHLTRTGATGSKDSDSTTEDKEEERVSAKEERARKKEERVKKKGKKEKGIKRTDSRGRGRRKRLNGRRGWKRLKKGGLRKRRDQCLTLR
jgi:hypothetical protein